MASSQELIDIFDVSVSEATHGSTEGADSDAACNEARKELVAYIEKLEKAAQLTDFDPRDHSTNEFPLRDLVDHCIELTIRFPGGNVTISGRVQYVSQRNGVDSQICIAESSLPADAIVRRESVGYGFVFYPVRQHLT